MNLKRCLTFSWKFVCAKTVKNTRSVIILSGCSFIFLLWYIQPDETLAKIQKACVEGLSEVTFEKEIAGGIKKSDDIGRIVTIAKTTSQHNGTVLVSVVNDAFLPFAYSWLCNTKHMYIHKSVLIITADDISKYKLNKDWPEVNVVKMNLGISQGNQEYSSAGYLQIMIRRTELLLELLMADIEVLLLEFDYMWFSNPLPNLQKMKGVDFLINPVSLSKEVVYNGGFLYMFPTNRSKALWRRLTEMMHDLGKQLHQKSNSYPVSEDENDQVYFSALVRQGFANVKTRELPLHTYADGKWYDLFFWQRKRQPTVISNNYVIGNLRKIKRAKRWNHWFLHDNCTCDFDLVRKMVNR